MSPSGAYSDVTSDTARRMRPYEAAAEAGAHVLLSGELGDVITLGISAHDALWDQLRAGEVRTFVRDSFDHCRLSRTQLWPLWVRMAAAASPLFINQADRTRHVRALATARGIPLATRSIPRSAMAKIFGIRADFLARVPTPDVPTPYDVRQFPRSHRSMLRGLHSFIAHNYVLGARGGLAVGTTFPFSHKPLVDFVLSVPCDVLWRPDHPRAFVAAALRDVLPPLIVERRTKGSALSAVSRFLIPTVLKDLDRVAEWQLVSRGYASPRELSDLLGALLTGSQSVPAIVIRLLSTEGLLRSLDTGRFTAAMAQAM